MSPGWVSFAHPKLIDTIFPVLEEDLTQHVSARKALMPEKAPIDNLRHQQNYKSLHQAQVSTPPNPGRNLAKACLTRRTPQQAIPTIDFSHTNGTSRSGCILNHLYRYIPHPFLIQIDDKLLLQSTNFAIIGHKSPTTIKTIFGIHQPTKARQPCVPLQILRPTVEVSPSRFGTLDLTGYIGAH